MAPEPLNRLVQATVVSLIGLRDVYRSEVAFRQELLVLLLVIPAAWLLTSVGVERALLIGSWMLVIVVEMVNSAIEAAIDRIGRCSSPRGPSSICRTSACSDWIFRLPPARIAISASPGTTRTAAACRCRGVSKPDG